MLSEDYSNVYLAASTKEEFVKDVRCKKYIKKFHSFSRAPGVPRIKASTESGVL
jgi:hypothetical protein